MKMRNQLVALCRALSPELVHVVFTGPTIYYETFMRPAHTAPTLLSFHGSWPHRFADGFLARSLSNAAWITACSESALADLRAMAPAVADRSSAILNGLDPPATPPTPLPFDPPVLLCAGRVEREKGFDVALAAFAEVLRSHPRARLLIAGDGTCRTQLEIIAQRLGLTQNVDFLGWVSPEAMTTLINRCTLALVPSRLEGFGLLALEAALMSRPVVASNVGGLPEVLGGAGVLVPSEDSDALAGAILRLLNEPQTALEEGANLHQIARRDFTAKRHADQYEELYAQLVAQEGSVAVC
jgi:glycogen(starch) synthase